MKEIAHHSLAIGQEISRLALEKLRWVDLSTQNA